MNSVQAYYAVNVNEVNDDMMEWCYNTFGVEGPTKKGFTRWFKVNKTFYFRNEKDSTWFILQWS